MTWLSGGRGAFCLLIVVFLFLNVAWAQEVEEEFFLPKPPMPEKFDWIQLTSGEWLKGELIAMYDESLEFDSDELDLLKLDWEDIAEIRTAGVMRIGFVHNVAAVGAMFMEGDTVRVIGIQDQTFPRDDLLTIAAGEQKEINFWAMKVMFGLNLRSGNTNLIESTLEARFERRTVRDRITISFLTNLNRTEVVIDPNTTPPTKETQTVSDNSRASIAWNRYVNKRLFVTPVFFEWYRDPFQNISHRETIAPGVGYELYDSAKIDWTVNAGIGYQRTTFDSVESGPNPDNTPALILGTIYDHTFTSWLEFFLEYRMQWVNERAGQYNHHMLASFETDITSLIDFDITLVWDRIQKPRSDSTGVTPEQDDYRLTVGLTFDF